MVPLEILQGGDPAPKLPGGLTCAVWLSWLSPYHQGYVLGGEKGGEERDEFERISILEQRRGAVMSYPYSPGLIPSRPGFLKHRTLSHS